MKIDSIPGSEKYHAIIQNNVQAREQKISCFNVSGPKGKGKIQSIFCFSFLGLQPVMSRFVNT